MTTDPNDEDDAFGEACYEAWRRGINPDRVSRDAIAAAYYGGCAGDSWEDAARNVVDQLARRDRERREEMEESSDA